jgi:hypothetical protein
MVYAPTLIKAGTDKPKVFNTYLFIHIHTGSATAVKQTQVRLGVRPEQFDEQLRPAALLVADRGAVASNHLPANAEPGSAAVAAGAAPLVATTAAHGSQRGENWKLLGAPGWCQAVGGAMRF